MSGLVLPAAASLVDQLDKRVLVKPVVAPPSAEGMHPEEAAKKAAAYTRNEQHKAIVRRVLALVILLDAAKRAECRLRARCAMNERGEREEQVGQQLWLGGVE